MLTVAMYWKISFILSFCGEITAYTSARSVRQKWISLQKSRMKKVYIQVTESMLAPETRARELRPLELIPDNYEKLVLSMDRSFVTSYEGIRAENLIDWLLEERSR